MRWLIDGEAAQIALGAKDAPFPEKFHPAIDFDWQKGQLAREREAEIAQGIRGPDGFPLPRR